MKPREQYDNMRNALIENIEFVVQHRQPDGWLPIKASAVVYSDIDENSDDGPMLGHCFVKEIFDDGECNARTLGSEEDEPYGLSEFLTENLIAIWEKYVQLAVEQSIWKGNAVAYMKEHTEFAENKINALIDKHWCPEHTFTENLHSICQQESGKELWIFTYPINRFNRNASDEEIVNDYENNRNADSLVVKMTPLEFTALINDEMFNDTDNWVRAIELPE